MTQSAKSTIASADTSKRSPERFEPDPGQVIGGRVVAAASRSGSADRRSKRSTMTAAARGRWEAGNRFAGRRWA